MSEQRIMVRAATPEDAEAILHAHYSAVNTTAAKDYGAKILLEWSRPVDPARINRYLTQSLPNETTLVAVVRKQIAAFGAIVESREELRALYVHADFAGAGVGTKLLEELETLAKLRGCNRLRLQSSTTAAGFYEKRGYARLSDGVHRLSSGAEMACVFMEKELI